MIREFQTSDTEQVMKIWLSGNEDAHPFVPDGYWRKGFCLCYRRKDTGLSWHDRQLYCRNFRSQKLPFLRNRKAAFDLCEAEL